MKKILILPLLLGLGVIAGCGRSADSPATVTVVQTVADNQVPSIYPQADYPGDPGTTDYPQGQPATVGSHTETVTNVVYPYTPAQTSSNHPKSSGGRFILVTIKITNSSDHEIDYNPFLYKLEDSQNGQSDHVSLTGIDRPLSSGTLAVGKEVVGSMVFEVVGGAEPTALLADQGHKYPPTRFKLP